MADKEFEADARMQLPPDEFIRVMAHDARALASLVVGWTDLMSTDPGAIACQIEGTEYTVADAMQLILDAANKLITQLNIVTPYVEEFKRSQQINGDQ